MEQFVWQSAGWLRAASLQERLAARPAGGARPGAYDLARARRRLERWRSEQPPFGQDYPFAQRLALEGIAEEELLLLLGEPDEALSEYLPGRPGWLAQLADAFATATGKEDAPSMPADGDPKRLLDTVWPLTAWGRRRLRQGVMALTRGQAPLPGDPDTIQSLFLPDLAVRLLPILERTIVLELNVARLRGQLQGDTSAERFESFLERFQRSEACLELMAEYPVLARLLVEAVDRWVNTCLEFLQRLCADWGQILEILGAGCEPGVLAAVDGELGDRHQGGREVLLLTFTSGWRLVYKPRPVASLAHFQELLIWFNCCGYRPDFRALAVLDRGSYGWVEFVHRRECHTSEEVERFYRRQGGYLALLYALETIDLHHENLIAVGEHPVLVDMECMFHPDLAPPTADPLLINSVHKVGLLPFRMWRNETSPGIDLSGLEGKGGQMTPNSVPQIEAVGTDEMRLVRRPVAIDGAENRPSLDGVEICTIDYQDALTEGFAQAYRLLHQKRAELLADDGPLARFAADSIRVIIRGTWPYTVLLDESYHPDALCDGLDYDRVLDHLWEGAGRRPYLPRLIPAEHADLLAGDIPLFTTRPNSTDLWSSTGRHIPALLTETGLARVHRTLISLSEEDLAQQLNIIRDAVGGSNG